MSIKQPGHKESKKMRTEIKQAHRLGFRVKVTQPKREDRGKRGGSIATIPINQLTPEQFKVLQQKADLQENGEYVLPHRLRLPDNMKDHCGSFATMIGKELACEVIAIKPDIKRIKFLIDPMAAKRKRADDAE